MLGERGGRDSIHLRRKFFPISESSLVNDGLSNSKVLVLIVNNARAGKRKGDDN